MLPLTTWTLCPLHGHHRALQTPVPAFLVCYEGVLDPSPVGALLDEGAPGSLWASWRQAGNLQNSEMKSLPLQC